MKVPSNMYRWIRHSSRAYRLWHPSHGYLGGVWLDSDGCRVCAYSTHMYLDTYATTFFDGSATEAMVFLEYGLMRGSAGLPPEIELC